MGQDHDLLIRIDANVDNLISTVGQHTKDDLDNFKEIEQAQTWMQRQLWMGMGGLAVLVFIVRAVWK